MLSSLHNKKAKSRFLSGKKLFLFLYFTFYIFTSAFSQNPLVKQWDYRFGGTNSEELFSVQQTFDGGYILGGQSNSGISGDKTQNNWDSLFFWTTDYWIIKIDSLGIKQWDKRFGGTFSEGISSLQQTNDGGYILGGMSLSGADGDKTQANLDTINIQTGDWWIVKTDSLGNKQWDKSFGGIDSDVLRCIRQTSDGGYISGGSFASLGSAYSIVKKNSLGLSQWSKNYGGAGGDHLRVLQQTSDGGYILGGFSNSDSSGDKTQDSWGVYDYWIIKIDAFGIKEWDKDFGGTDEDFLFSLEQTIDGGYILGGLSKSGISGDKTQASWGGNDYWIVKIDSVGNKQWDAVYGGVDNEDVFGNISQTADGGYLFAGTSESDSSGNKTQDNLAAIQTWVVKTDSVGNKQWDRTLLTMGFEFQGLALQTNDLCYLMANNTHSLIAGDKTQDPWGGYDYWIIKFCDSTLTTGSPTPALPEREGVAIAPNPASDEITITSHSTISKIEILNLPGQTVMSASPSPSGRVGVGLFPSGIYIIKATTEKGVFQQKLVINH